MITEKTDGSFLQVIYQNQQSTRLLVKDKRKAEDVMGQRKYS